MYVKTFLDWSPNKNQIHTWKLYIRVCSLCWFDFLATWPKSGCGLAMQTGIKRSWPWQNVWPLKKRKSKWQTQLWRQQLYNLVTPGKTHIKKEFKTLSILRAGFPSRSKSRCPQHKGQNCHLKIPYKMPECNVQDKENTETSKMVRSKTRQLYFELRV